MKKTLKEYTEWWSKDGHFNEELYKKLITKKKKYKMSIFNLTKKKKKKNSDNMNQINVINPYKYHGQWVFDDESKGLDKEPFVAGADTLIDTLTGGLTDSCQIIFSKDAFPTANFVVDKVDAGPAGGTNYKYNAVNNTTHKLWLCPALLKYFSNPPNNIHFQIK